MKKVEGKNIVYLFVGLLVGLAIGWIAFSPVNPFFSRNDKFTKIRKFIYTVEKNYVNEVDVDKLLNETFNYLVSDLDPYSFYMDTLKYLDYKMKTNGKFYGYGMEISLYNDSLLVVRVMENSPAQKAGIRVGDIILAINNHKLSGEEEVFKRYLTIFKSNKDKANFFIKDCYGKTKNLIIRTAELEMNPIYFTTLSDSIGYIKIQNFNKNISTFFHESLEFFSKQKIENLIIDLRDNSGGYLNEALNMLDEFFDKKQLLVKIMNKNNITEKYSNKGGLGIGVKVIVLVNKKTASSAEIFAGVLQDYDKGIIMGLPTRGKGVGQSDFRISDYEVLHLTTNKIILPSGRWIQANATFGERDTNFYKTFNGRKVVGGTGIIPDVPYGSGLFASDFIYEFSSQKFINNYRQKICRLSAYPDSLYNFMYAQSKTYLSDFVFFDDSIFYQNLIWRVFDILHFSFVDSLRVRKDFMIIEAQKYFNDTIYYKILSPKI